MNMQKLGINLKILATVLITVAAYTWVANAIPQIESAVPQQITLGADMTVDQLVSAGEEIFEGAGGCTACHGLGTRAPTLLTASAGTGPIGARCSERVEGMTCEAYLHESLVNPGAHVVDGFAPIMQDMSRTLSGAQIWALVAFLQSHGGEVTVDPAEIAAASEAAGSGAAGSGRSVADAGTAGAAGSGATSAAGSAGSASLEPMAIMEANQCLVCHQVNGEGGAIGPSLDGIGGRADLAYIRRAILNPRADTAQGYGALAGTMPTNFGTRLSAAQFEALIQYMAELE